MLVIHAACDVHCCSQHLSEEDILLLFNEMWSVFPETTDIAPYVLAVIQDMETNIGDTPLPLHGLDWLLIICSLNLF